MMTALMLPVLLVGIGAAVTISDATSKKAKLQMHADVMSLAMAKINNFESKRKAEEYYDNYIATQLDEDATCTQELYDCLLYTSPSPRDLSTSRMPSSA